MTSNNTTIDHGIGNSKEIPWVDFFLLPAYALAITIGVGGNSLVISVVKRKRSMHSTTNYLLANLAVSDLLNLIWCIPGLVMNFVEHHPTGALGDFLCKFVTMQHLAGITQLVSGLTLTVLAIERYNALFHPLNTRFRLKNNTIRYPIIIMWIFAVLFVVPLFVFEIYNIEYANCYLAWPYWELAVVYWGILAFIVLVCFMAMIFCYFNIIKGIYFSKTICARGHGGLVEDRISKRRIVKLLLSVTLVFCVCFVPFIVVSVLYSDVSKNVVYKLSYFLVYCSSSLNPLIYAFHSSNYREAFSEILVDFSNRLTKTCENRANRMKRRHSSLERQTVVYHRSLNERHEIRLLSFRRLEI